MGRVREWDGDVRKLYEDDARTAPVPGLRRDNVLHDDNEGHFEGEKFGRGDRDDDPRDDRFER